MQNNSISTKIIKLPLLVTSTSYPLTIITGHEGYGKSSLANALLQMDAYKVDGGPQITTTSIALKTVFNFQ